MSAKKLRGWGIAAALSSAGVVYALYEINEHGQLIDVSDVNLDGWTDEHRIDVDYDGVADLKLVDQDYDGSFDMLQEMDGKVLADGEFFEGFLNTFSSLFG